MKKLLIKVLIGLLVLVIVAILAIGFFLDSAVKRGVETVGPMLTQVEVKLDGVNLSLLSGSGTIKGLRVGNPDGYKTPTAINVGTASLAVQPGSVLGDKIIIKSIIVQAPEITFETDLKGNNLSKILANVEAATGGSGKQPAETKPSGGASKKLQVDDFLISGGKINVSVTALGGKSMTVPLPDIHLTALGTGPEGITAGELTKVVLKEIEKSAVQASSAAVADLSKQADALAKDLGKAATDKATKSIGDLFKKK
jgi:hypothetical protein